ncbi:conserved hypothetical protein [Paecilomyces variotii No. 5]|uniref:Leucine-rich repeat domain-containing protein n=1 Tax=Byssochlamys spectabilis (strain No. 5 / NBRC 109023) TaxID=1356009 RepID=V5G2R1_BYSSN|nr:conserved hypothetical protein [Paecilomyces variotii No. 5]
MGPPTLISALPPEIIIHTSQNLHNRDDLLNFSYTCRYLYDLLSPQVYHEPVTTLDDFSLGEIHRAASFVQTILRRPNLARSVQHLRIKLDRSDLRGDVACTLHPDLEYDHTLIGDAVKATAVSIQERKDWEIDIAAGNCDAWLALLFPVLSNLKTLVFIFSSKTRFITRMLERAIYGQRPFVTQNPLSSLNEVTALWYIDISVYDDNNNIIGYPSSEKTLDVTLFAKLPALQTLRGRQLTLPVHGPDQISHQLQPDSSPITTLSISSSISEDGILGLIKACKTVKYLRYTEYGDRNGFHADSFRRSLPLTKESLEELWIDYGDHTYPYLDAENNWLGSFHDFSRLRKLHIRLANLFSWRPSTASHARTTPKQRLTSLLPPAIETLCITECMGEQGQALVSQLEDLISNKQTYVSRLSQLEIYIDFMIEPDTRDHLKSLCEEEQVDFAIRRWWDPTDMKYPSRDDGYILQDTFWCFDR